jgi:hypothetical protein
VNAPAAAAQQPIKHSTKFELHVFRLVSLNEKNSLGAVFFLLVALPLASAACTSGGNKTGTLLLAPDLWWRLVLPLAVRRSEFAVIEDVDTTTTWINDTMSFDESAIPGIGELSCADAFALAVPSFFVGSSLGDVDGWAQNWLGNRWSSLAAGTPGTVDIRVGLPGEMTTTTPSPWLPPWESTTTTTEVISLPLQAVSDVHAGAVTFLDVPGGGERSISTTRIVLNHQLSTVSTLTRANKEDPLARDKLNITHVNVTTFFAPFVRASLNNLWTFHSVVLRPLESDRFDKPPWLLQGGHDFVRVCTCDDRNATERCPATIHFKAVWGPSHICPVGAFVIKRHLPESQRWAPLQRQFSCVQFQEPPPSIAGVHNLTYDQLIVTIDGCRMVYDHGVVQMGGINDAELFAFTLSTARCRHAAYFVGCGPLIIAHSGHIAASHSTLGTGTLVRDDANVTNVLCRRCAEDFGAFGSEGWCRCCLANCQNSRDYCNSEGYCQPEGHTCPGLCPSVPKCPVTEPVPPPADGRKCAGSVTDHPPPPAPTPRGPATTTATDVGTRIELTPSPFKLPPCIDGASGCNGGTYAPAPTPTPPTPRAVPCEFNRFTGRCSRDDCPVQLSHKCAMQIANKTASCACVPVAPCEWSETEKRCIGGGGVADGSACAANGSPCLPLQRSDGKIVCNATCAVDESGVSVRLGALASLRAVAPARTIAPIAVGVDTTLPIDSNAGSLALVVDWRSVAKAPADVTLLTVLLRFRDELLLLSAASTAKMTSTVDRATRRDESSVVQSGRRRRQQDW